MAGLLHGRRIVVTAAAGTGIGFATARRCALDGADVLLSDRHAARLEEYRARLEAETGRPVHAVPCDVTVEDEVRHLVSAADEMLGWVDGFVNNAALGMTSTLVETTDEAWGRVIETTLTATMRCVRAELPLLVARRRGAIVNLGSVVAWRAEAGQTAYAAAKAGVLALTRCAALEVADSGVRVNAVVPSLALHENLVRVSDPDFLAGIAAAEAFGRAATPDEIARVAAFLLSDLASYMTGESVAVSSRHP